MESTRVLAIAGMHRSGTSLTASWLAQSGLNVGDDLLENCPDNPLGHYEDMSFLRLHQDILRDNGVNYLVSDTRQLVVNSEYAERARNLLQARAGLSGWGWKDPRASLFLEFWKSLVPAIKVLVVYRHFSHVSESLFRREMLKWRGAHPRAIQSAPWWLAAVGNCARNSMLNVPKLRLYLAVWQRYNMAILSFISQYPEDCIVIRAEDILTRSESLIDFFNSNWGFCLKPVAATDVYAPELFHNRSQPIRTRLMTQVAPYCRETYAELEYWRTRSLTRISISESRGE